MKLLTLKFGGKTYTTGKITTFLSKESLKVQKESLALAKKGQAMQGEQSETDLDAVEELLDTLLELKERKVWLICEIYGNKFTSDEVEKHLSDEEVDAQIQSVAMGIAEVVRKN